MQWHVNKPPHTVADYKHTSVRGDTQFKRDVKEASRYKISSHLHIISFCSGNKASLIHNNPVAFRAVCTKLSNKQEAALCSGR